MRLVTPDSLHYPITVTKLLRKTGDEVDRNAPIFSYYYKSTVIEGDADNKEGKPVVRTWPSTFESYIEGTITDWFIKPNQVITRRGTAIAEVEEPCKHEVQFGGMCANCGKDMTTVEYNTITRDTARATVNTVHGHTALLISQAEASRSDEEAKRRLTSTRKLSLVVDLDQTIIQAAVDPTIVEWQNDPNNPNHNAVKDVRSFQLNEDGGGARGCWYYIKLRPGLKEFLESVSKNYELHIYTMGTRAYAKAIAKIVDPERKIFADRVLSRDESGSMTVKSLKRLFPVDTRMVVIIDDRGDVWQWSQNLIRVTAYDFFVGIGDINSSYLPKRPELEVARPPPRPQPSSKDTPNTEQSEQANGNADPPVNTIKPAESSSQTPAAPQSDGDVSTIDQLMSMGASNDPSKLAEQTSEQNETIAAQLADRPLLQKQKILEAAEEALPKDDTSELAGQNNASKEVTPVDSPNKYRHNLLVDDDTQLEHLERNLRNIHSSFYDEYDRRLVGSQGGRIAELRPGHGKKRSTDGLELLPDVTSIMAGMKQTILRGVSLVFSGVVPLGVNIHDHDLAVWARSFGAAVTDNITKKTTHVIASPYRRTSKVRQAAKRPDRISIVTQHWLSDCLSRWQKLDEGPYKTHVDLTEEGGKTGMVNGSPFDEPSLDALLSSSDDEAAVTEEEAEAPNGLTVQTKFDNAEDVELQAHMPSLSREDSSPDEESREDWEGMEDELADFLGSDAEEGSESEAESTKSDGSETSTPSSSASKKRKRTSKENNVTDGEDSDASVSSASRLQKRKRKALARTTSLNNAAVAGSTPDAQAADIKSTELQDGKEDDAADDDEDDDDDLEAELEAEMLRQAEEDGDSDDGDRGDQA